MSFFSRSAAGSFSRDFQISSGEAAAEVLALDEKLRATATTKQIKTVVTDDHQLMHRPPGVLVLLVEAARAAGFTTEDVLVKLHRSFQILHDKSQMIDFGLHKKPPGQAF